MGGIFGAIFGGGASAALQYASEKKLQEDRQQHQTNMYKNRYQWQMEDMRKGGLNPILSYRTGAPGTTGGGAGPASGVGQAAIGGAKVGSAVGLATAQTRTQEETQNLLKAQTGKATEEALAVRYQNAIDGIRAAWHIANPTAIAGAEAAEMRRRTGKGKFDQLGGGAMQRIEEILESLGLTKESSSANQIERERQLFNKNRRAGEAEHTR